MIKFTIKFVIIYLISLITLTVLSNSVSYDFYKYLTWIIQFFMITSPFIFIILARKIRSKWQKKMILSILVFIVVLVFSISSLIVALMLRPIPESNMQGNFPYDPPSY